jgi:FkbH-like protein
MEMAMRSGDEQPGLENEIHALMAEGKQHLAWARIRDRLLERADRSVYSLAASFADKVDRESADLVPARVALLGSFTLDPIVPILKARALSCRVLAQTYIGPFNVWQQEVLSEQSGLRRFNPDVIFLALRPEDLAPDLVYGFLGLSETDINAQVAQATEALESFLAALRQWSKAKVVVHSLPAPVYPALGILDHELPGGQSAAFREWNRAWLEVARRTPGACVMDCDRLVREIGWSRWYDARFWAVARLPLSSAALERIAEEYAKYLQAFFGVARKVLVLDLDNTLWGGIIGEDGFHGIQLSSEYPGSAFVELQRLILSLHDRGVVLAINSKNNPEDAQQVIETHPAMVLRQEHFAATRINWNDKAQNLQELAQELNLNLDSFVYVDDNAVECERVRQALPQVLTIHMVDEPALRPNRMRRLAGLFDTLEYSSEDRARNAMYRAEGARKGLRCQVASLEDFYISLDMELIIDPLDESSLTRAAQMTQRTNQFNLTTRRRSESDLAALSRSGQNEIYTARLRDRFGDDGSIALAIIRCDDGALFVDTFLMSCRVIGREVETAFMTFLLRRAQALRCREVIGEYRPTKKNRMVADFYAKQGFEMLSRCEEATLWRLKSEQFQRDYPKWFRTDRITEVTAYEFS